MAINIKDRIKQGSNTYGTGTLNLNVSYSSSGFQDFSVLGDGAKTYYAIEESPSGWEVGIGTYSTGSPAKLSRDTVLSSSNNGSRVDFQGSGLLYVTYPAEKAVFGDENNVVSITGLSVGQTGITFNDGTNQSTAANPYLYWKATDGSNTSNITTTGNVKVTGAGSVTVSLSSGATNTFTVSGESQDLSSYATKAYVTGASGHLQTQITQNSNNIASTGATNASSIATNASNISSNTSNINTVSGLLYNNWTIQGDSSATSGIVDKGELVKITGAGSVSVSLGGTDNRTVTVSGQSEDLSSYATTDYVTGVSGDLQTKITQNTNNIASTGATNAAAISIVSGIATGKDNYQYWTVTDGSNSENIQSTNTVKFTGAGNTTVSYAASGNTVTISGTAGGGGGGDYNFKVTDGDTSPDTISSGQTVTWTGAGNTTVSYNTSSNVFNISGADQDLSSYATTNYVTGVSGDLNAKISANTYSWTATGINTTGSRSGSVIESSDVLSVSGTSGVGVTFSSGTGSEPNQFTVSHNTGVLGNFGLNLTPNNFISRVELDAYGHITGLGYSGVTGAGGSGNYDNWKLAAFGASSTDIDSGETVTFKGVNGASVTRAANTITIDAAGASGGGGISCSDINIVGSGSQISVTRSDCTFTIAITGSGITGGGGGGNEYTHWILQADEKTANIQNGYAVTITGAGNNVVSMSTGDDPIVTISGVGEFYDGFYAKGVNTGGGAVNQRIENNDYIDIRGLMGLTVTASGKSGGVEYTVSGFEATDTITGVVKLDHNISGGSATTAATPSGVKKFVTGHLEASGYQYWTASDGLSTTQINKHDRLNIKGVGIVSGVGEFADDVSTITISGLRYTAGTGVHTIADSERIINVKAGTTSQSGIVLLDHDISGASPDTAATPSGVKEYVDDQIATSGFDYWTLSSEGASTEINKQDTVTIEGKGIVTGIFTVGDSSSTIKISGKEYSAGQGIGINGSRVISVTGIDGGMIVNGTVTNADLVNDSITITGANGITGGGEIELGGTGEIGCILGSTSATGIVMLQDSAEDGVTDKAITPNAVYDISGILRTDIDAKAPKTGSYLVLELSPDLSHERNFVAGTGLAGIDAGANNSFTLGISGIDSTMIVDGTVANVDLVNDSVTVNAGNGLNGGGEVDLGGSPITINVSGIDGTMIVNNSIPNEDLINDDITITAGTGLHNGGAVVLGSSVRVDVSGIDSSMIVNGSVANVDLVHDSVTVTPGTGLGNAGEIDLGTSKTIDITGIDSTMIVDGTVANVDLVHDSVTVTAGTGLGNGGEIDLGTTKTIDITGIDSTMIVNGSITCDDLGNTVNLDCITDNGATTTNNITIGMLDASGVRTPMKSGTGGSPQTFDLATASVFTHTMSASTEYTFNATNPTAGQRFMVRLENGGSSTVHTTGWFGDGATEWPSQTAPTLTSTAGFVDVFGFLCLRAGHYEGFIIAQNISGV